MVGKSREKAKKKQKRGGKHKRFHVHTKRGAQVGAKNGEVIDRRCGAAEEMKNE
jgi:hypothetical protein